MIPNIEIETLNYKDVSKQNSAGIDALLTGYRITGAELIDYPLTDGILLYLQGKGENKKVLEIGLNWDGDFEINLSD